jgi:flagellar assembly factor FliW
MPTTPILTSRFGRLEIESLDVICFPAGLLGLDGCLHWVLLADADNDAVGWLQATTQAEVALAVVSPRRFVPDYQVRVNPSELEPLGLDIKSKVSVLAIVSSNEQQLTLNLKAPLIIHRERRLGRQVIVNGNEPLQYEFVTDHSNRKRIA